MAKFSLKRVVLAGGLTLATTTMSFAQDSGALLNLLAQKGIITDQEAEDLRAELTKEFTANTAAGKMNLGSHVTEFKLSGDVRLRHQIETQAPETASGSHVVSNERTRERFRFRLNGDVLMQKGWGAGFALETASAADSGNQTFENGNDDYALSIARAYVSWQYSPELLLVGGKQKNPFYTSDLVWDSDINPQGLSEIYKRSVSAKDTFEIRASQIIMDDLTENAAGTARDRRDAWLFAQQAVYTHWFGSDELGNKINSLILAPGFMTYNDSTLTGLANENSANLSTASLAVFTFAGEASWKGALGEGSSLKLYWDTAYNLEAGSRVRKVYGLTNPAIDEDPLAWVIGVGYAKGSGKVQGDYNLKLDYRQVGLGSVDANLNDSDFAFGKLNQEGFKLGGAYNLTDFAAFNFAYFYTNDIQDKITYSLASLDHSQILQLDLVVKF
jgi:hypothetical protein